MSSRFTFSFGKESVTEYDSFFSDAILEWETFIADEVFPYLNNLYSDSLHIFFSGAEIESHQTFQVLYADCAKAGAASVAVLFCVYIHLNSFILTILANIVVSTAIPLGYVTFRIFSGKEEFSMVNCVALFFVT